MAGEERIGFGCGGEMGDSVGKGGDGERDWVEGGMVRKVSDEIFRGVGLVA